MLPISYRTNLTNVQSANNQTKKNHDSSKSILIKQIALKAIKEFAVLLSISLVTMCFMTSPIGVAVLFLDAITVVFINTIVRYLLETYKHHEKVKCNPMLKYITAIMFSQFDVKTRDVIVHESGHAFAARLGFRLRVNPIIEVFRSDPILALIQTKGGGVTKMSAIGFTKFGEFIGPLKSKILFAAGGAIASVFCSTLSIMYAHRIRKTNPELSRYLNVTAIVSLANHALYALSAIGNKTKDYSHDFVRLAILGVNPIVCVTMIVAIPIIVKLGLIYLN